MSQFNFILPTSKEKIRGHQKFDSIGFMYQNLQIFINTNLHKTPRDRNMKQKILRTDMSTVSIFKPLTV